MNRFVLFATFVAGAVVMGSACAQWQLSAGLGARQLRVSETEQNGRDMVLEHGWLPGVELRADYMAQDWRVSVAGETYRRSIAYDGQMQSGVPFSTETDTAQSRIGIELSKQITDAARMVGGIEWDRWQRDIRGRGKVMGLNERYTSWRLLAGAELRVLQADWARLYAKALVVRAAPERLQVRFDNHLFDDASLSTQPATGLRLAFGLHPTAWPNMAVTTELDWMRIGRSDDAVLYRGGTPSGLVTQAEHARKALSMRIHYRF